MLSGFHSLLVMPVRVPAVGPAVGAAAAADVGAAATGVAAAGGALVGAAACWALRLPHASIRGIAASTPPAARPYFKNDLRLTLEPEFCDT
jgi:hypothetical protein